MLDVAFASKTHEIHVNASITAIVLAVISFHVLGENWKHLRIHLPFRCFLCVRIKIESC